MRPSSVRVECPKVRMDGVASEDLIALPLTQLLLVLFLHRLNNMTVPVFFGGKRDRIWLVASCLDREPSDLRFRTVLPLSTLRFRSIEWCSLSGIANSEPPRSSTKCITFEHNSSNYSWIDCAGVAGTRESRQVQVQKTTRFYN